MMSHLLEVLGRGLIAQLVGAFDSILGTNTEEEIEDLERLVETCPSDVSARVWLGGKLLRSDRIADARRIFEAIIAQDPEHFAARIGLACALDALGRVDLSLEQLRTAQKADPLNPSILFCLGYCHERLNQDDAAITYYEDSISVCPTLRNAHERLAAIYLRREMIEAAADHYTRLCELDPEQTELQLGLANLLLKQGEHQKAIARYEYALSLEPDNWTVHNDVVSAYEEAGLIREAIEHLHKMIEKEPEFADTRLRLGDMYARIGNDSAATLQYERAAQISPDYLEANVKLGTQHLRAGRFEQASQWFSTALELNDRLLSAYVGIGVAQHASGRTAEALSSFEMARNIEPNSTLLFSEVARMHLKAAAGQQSERFILGSNPAGESDTPEHLTDLLSQQIQRVRDAITQSPNHADLHYRLGLLLRNRGQLDDAIASFRQAATINPTYMKALIKLGLALSEADQTEEAIDVFKQATDVRPDYVDLHYQIGLLFVQRNQFEMAVEHFEQAVSGNPGNVAFQANLALSLQNMGLIDRAQATWQIVSELAPDSEYAEQAQRAMAKSREE